MDEAAKQSEHEPGQAVVRESAVVLPFASASARQATMPAQQPLTGEECARLRAMLEAFDRLTSPTGCPVARSVLLDP